MFLDRVKPYVYVIDRQLRIQQFKYIGSAGKGGASAFVIARRSIGFPNSNKSGNHLAYLARKDGRVCVVKDNEIVAQCYERVFLDTLQISPDVSQISYAAGEGKKAFVVFGDKEERRFDQVSYISFSPNWSVRAYSGRVWKLWTLVVNGIPKGLYESSAYPVTFSSNGKSMSLKAIAFMDRTAKFWNKVSQ